MFFNFISLSFTLEIPTREAGAAPGSHLGIAGQLKIANPLSRTARPVSAPRALAVEQETAASPMHHTQIMDSVAETDEAEDD